jgi:hypothetical protein
MRWTRPGSARAPGSRTLQLEPCAFAETSRGWLGPRARVQDDAAQPSSGGFSEGARLELQRPGRLHGHRPDGLAKRQGSLHLQALFSAEPLDQGLQGGAAFAAIVAPPLPRPVPIDNTSGLVCQEQPFTGQIQQAQDGRIRKGQWRRVGAGGRKGHGTTPVTGCPPVYSEAASTLNAPAERRSGDRRGRRDRSRARPGGPPLPRDRCCSAPARSPSPRPGPRDRRECRRSRWWVPTTG